MRRIIFLLSFIGCFSSVLFAGSTLVKQANDLYRKTQYADAARMYEKALTEGVAPELYYNLGNAYYKSNETGKAILNYERALRLNPSFEDARVNLEIAQLKVVDNIVQPPSFFVKRWVVGLIKLCTSDQWLMVSFFVFIVSLVLGFFFVFAPSVKMRKIAFYAGIILLSVSLVSLIFSGVRKNQLQNHREAIVMTGAVTVKSSPDKSGTDLFQLHEGTKVIVKSTLGQWIEIKLGNGNVGWVEAENIEKI